MNNNITNKKPSIANYSIRRYDKEAVIAANMEEVI